MRTWLPVIVYLFISASAATARARVPNVDDPAPVETTLDASIVETSLAIIAEQPRPVLSLRIDGAGPFTFLLDTGASVTVLTESLRERLALTATDTLFIGSDLEIRQAPDPAAENTLTVDAVMLNEVTIEAALFRGVPAIVLGPSAQPMHLGVDGILGISCFHDCLATIDYPARRLRLETGELPPADGGEVLDFTWDEGIPMIPVTIAGAPHMAHLDSGSPIGLTVPASVAETLPFTADLAVVGRARTLNAEFEIREAPLDGAVSIGAHRFDAPVVRVQGRMPAVNVGYELLRGFAITLDQRAARVRFGRSESTNIPPPSAPRVHVASGGSPRLGVAIRRLPDGLEIRQTMPGLPAAAAGLRVGDVVRRVNGHAVAEYTDAELGPALRAFPLTLGVERDGETIEIVVDPS